MSSSHSAPLMGFFGAIAQPPPSTPPSSPEITPPSTLDALRSRIASAETFEPTLLDTIRVASRTGPLTDAEKPPEPSPILREAPSPTRRGWFAEDGDRVHDEATATMSTSAPCTVDTITASQSIRAAESTRQRVLSIAHMEEDDVSTSMEVDEGEGEGEGADADSTISHLAPEVQEAWKAAFPGRTLNAAASAALLAVVGSRGGSGVVHSGAPCHTAHLLDMLPPETVSATVPAVASVAPGVSSRSAVIDMFRSLAIPLTPAMETELFCEPHIYHTSNGSVMSPACVMGKLCCARSSACVARIPGLPPNVTLEAIRPPLVDDAFRTRGVVPSQGEFCVLCHRYYTLQAALHFAMTGTETPPNLVWTRYTNTVRGPGQYREELCIGPTTDMTDTSSPQRWNGFIGFVVLPLVAGYLRAYRDPGGYWRIDQSALIQRETSRAAAPSASAIIPTRELTGATQLTGSRGDTSMTRDRMTPLHRGGPTLPGRWSSELVDACVDFTTGGASSDLGGGGSGNSGGAEGGMMPDEPDDMCHF